VATAAGGGGGGATHLALLQLLQDAEQLVVDHLDTLHGGLLQALDLHAHEHLERLGADKQ